MLDSTNELPGKEDPAGFWSQEMPLEFQLHSHWEANIRHHTLMLLGLICKWRNEPHQVPEDPNRTIYVEVLYKGQSH